MPGSKISLKNHYAAANRRGSFNQHARNTLFQSTLKVAGLWHNARGPRNSGSGPGAFPDESAGAFKPLPFRHKQPSLTLNRLFGVNHMYSMKMSEGGRVVIPAEIRKTLGIKDGDIVLWELVDGEARLTTKRERMRRAQTLIRQYVPEGVSLVDELVAERRAEFERE
jgi:AbrB family looped-hinge helix DNA binding protein